MRDKVAGWRGTLPAGVIGVVAGSLLLWRLALTTGLSGDVFWQWTVGQWMLAHHRLLTHDVFSYTVRGRPWFAEEWGYEVLLACLVRAVGPVAFWLLSAGVGTLTLWTVALRIRREAGWTWAGALTLLLAIGLLLFQRDRPQELSYWFFALEFVGLAALRRTPRWALVFVPLMAVWANIHGSFLLGLLVLALEVAVSLAQRVRWGRLQVLPPRALGASVVAFVGGSLATLVNPHGIGLWSYAYHVASNPAIANVIQEWQPPDFHQPILLILVVLPLAYTVFMLAWSDRPVPLDLLLLTGLLLVATLDSVRFMPYFLIAWCMLAATLPPFEGRREVRSPLTLVALVALGVVLLSGHTYPPGTTASDQPVAAVTFLTGRPGRVFATYRWGDYLIHAHIPVFIDGRTDLYTGTGVLGMYLAVDNLTIDPDTVFRDYRVRYVLWPPDTALATFLSHDPAWRIIDMTPNCLIFEHAGSWVQRGTHA